ncbi:unnamed protein product [Closterium sp. Naga37s-1]|nr:unnamed protein product [Closterium sp. Naga37s-1]CAI5533047.1 unnamed protein product [Closterium sp. Naga37s-1]
MEAGTAQVGRRLGASRGAGRTQRALQADQYEAAQELREKIAEIDRETRALQADQYEAAQELREKIAEIDRETARQRDAKAAISFASAAPPSPIPCANHAAAPTAAPSAAPSAVPSAALSAAPASFYAITFPHPYFSACPLCREELQQAAYGGKTGEGEGEVKAVRCRFQLGQRVQHCRHAYTAVVGGVDSLLYRRGGGRGSPVLRAGHRELVRSIPLS